MPYIKQEFRDRIDPALDSLIEVLTYDLEDTLGNAGTLNYIITRLIVSQAGDEPTYRAVNNTIGILECAKLEFYRRYAAPYEDEKAHDNGDVY